MRIWLQNFKKILTSVEILKKMHKKLVSTNTCTHYSCIS